MLAFVPGALAEDDDARTEAAALRALGITPTPEKVAAAVAWDRCTHAAVDRFAEQSEPARTVAEAAIAACTMEQGRYMIAFGILSESVNEATMPGLVARVMERRAAHANPGK